MSLSIKDRLSRLPDDVLLTILSYVPQKTAISTSLLSKRYKEVWKYMENLSIVGTEENHELINDFLNCLRFHKAPTLRNFKLCLKGGRYNSEEIRSWLESVLTREVEKLDIDLRVNELWVVIPSSIFCCQSLRGLQISGSLILMYIPENGGSLPSLEKLVIQDVENLKADDFQKLLDFSPRLKSLYLRIHRAFDTTPFTVSSNSLEKLSFHYGREMESIKVNTPSLKSLDLVDCTCPFDDIGGTAVVIQLENMPELEEANLEVLDIDTSSLMRSIHSVNKLSICFSKDVQYPHDGVLYKNLENLKLCNCLQSEVNIHNILRACPYDRVLNIETFEGHSFSYFKSIQSPPQGLVPESTLENLETLIWKEYISFSPDIDILQYILRKARALKNVDISFHKEQRLTSVLREELLEIKRASPTCQVNVNVIEIEYETSSSESEGHWEDAMNLLLGDWGR